MKEDLDLQAQLQASLTECGRLKEEIGLLKGLLTRHSISLPKEKTPRNVPEEDQLDDKKIELTVPATAEANIFLFRSLFRGREDVYAERWQNKDGRFGYMPACEKNLGAIL